jgi:hypothetical protein
MDMIATPETENGIYKAIKGKQINLQIHSPRTSLGEEIIGKEYVFNSSTHQYDQSIGRNLKSLHKNYLSTELVHKTEEIENDINKQVLIQTKLKLDLSRSYMNQMNSSSDSQFFSIKNQQPV